MLWIWQHIIDTDYSVVKVWVKEITLDMTTYHLVIVVTLFSGIIVLSDISMWIWQHIIDTEYSVVKVRAKDISLVSQGRIFLGIPPKRRDLN